MWDNIVKQLSNFPNAVLTGIDTGGYPFSLRCTPHVDEIRKVLLITHSGDEHIQPGPAGLLCHSHNEKMWSLKSFQILGSLELAEQGWIFHVERSIPDSSQGLIDRIKGLNKPFADAKKYLEKRGLPRPKVDWDGIKSLRKEAEEVRK